MSEQLRRSHLTVLDVMTSDVVTASATDPIKAVADRLYQGSLSALPVVDADRHVLGVISEDDLMVKEGGATDANPLHPRHRRAERNKAAALVASDAMTAPPICALPGTPVAEVARTMHRQRVKMVPVVDDSGKLLGVVSRHDVLKIFSRSDDSIRDEVIHGVFARDVMISTYGVGIEVEDGVVELSGEIERRSMVAVIGSLVAGIDGVIGVKNRLTYRWDDIATSNLDTLNPDVAGIS